MGTVTFSGFNNIDWNQVLNAVMTQESQPLNALQDQKTALKSQKTAFTTLSTRIDVLSSAAEQLGGSAAFGERSATVSDGTTVAVTSSSKASPGNYEIVVNELARSQVTTTTSTHADADQTVVATGGSLKINGATVTLTGNTTLQGLADAINGTADIGVNATIVKASGNYEIVLTGAKTGQANAFTVTNQLVNANDPDGKTVTFSGTNAVNATDADITVNNVHVTSETNSIDGVLGGGSIALLKKTASPVTVTIARDTSALEDKLKSFASAYNDLAQFLTTQNNTAVSGSASSIGRDSVLRGLRTSLREVMSRTFDTGGKITALAQVGVGFTRDGHLQFDASKFADATENNLEDVEKLLSPSAGTGAFDEVKKVLDSYSDSQGLVPNAMSRLDTASRNLDSRIADMQARLDLRRAALMREYAATDSAIASLNAQKSSLSSLGNEYRLF